MNSLDGDGPMPSPVASAGRMDVTAAASPGPAAVTHIADGDRFSAGRRALLAAQDARLRRCGWCGDWCYGRAVCDTCGAADARTELPAERKAS